ncbi:hypothetical protein ACRRTK_003871 [Alexandromys fortis]
MHAVNPTSDLPNLSETMALQEICTIAEQRRLTVVLRCKEIAQLSLKTSALILMDLDMLKTVSGLYSLEDYRNKPRKSMLLWLLRMPFFNVMIWESLVPFITGLNQVLTTHEPGYPYNLEQAKGGLFIRFQQQ